MAQADFVQLTVASKLPLVQVVEENPLTVPSGDGGVEEIVSRDRPC